MKNSDYTNSEKPIYPRLDGTPVHPSEFIGLTKREYFAGLAMQGMLAGEPDRKPEYLIPDAIAIADELLKQLESK